VTAITKSTVVEKVLAPLLFAPILFGFALDGGRRRIFAFDPMMRATGSISRILALGDDALAAEQACVLEHERTIMLVLGIEHQAAARLADQPGQ